MEPQHLIRTVRRRWRPLVLLAVVGASLGAASAAVAEDAAPAPVPTVYYDACHTLLVDSSISSLDEVLDPNLAQSAQRVTQGDIPEVVAAALDADIATLQTQVRVSVRNDIQSLTVCAVNPTPAGAEATSDVFASQLLAHLEKTANDLHRDRVERARSEVEVAQACWDEANTALTAAELAGATFDETSDLRVDRQICNSRLQSAKSQLTAYEASGAPRVPLETLDNASAVEISEAQYDAQIRRGAAGGNVEMGIGESFGSAVGSVPTSSNGPAIPDGPVPRAGIGAVLGIAAGMGFVVFTERLDSKLRSKLDVETTLDLPVLAEIPPLARRDRKSTRIVTLEEPRSRTAESFRALRSALDYARQVDQDHGRLRDGAQVILVTSAGPSEGKTTTVANLATVLAEGDRRVLAINCDFRRPRLHRYLGGTAHPQRLNVTDVPGVQLVTQVTENDGDSTPSDVVTAQRRLVERARERFDVILLDTAPILTTNDAAELLGVSDHVVMVVNAAETKAESAARASELLERRGLAPLGVALVGARDVPNASDYYYDDDDPYLEPSGRRRRGSAADADDHAAEDALTR